MTSPTIEERLVRAWGALNAYAPPAKRSHPCRAAELLCDLMHWLDAEDLDIDDKIYQARVIYDREIAAAALPASPRKYLVGIRIVEDYSAVLQAEDRDGAFEAADKLFSTRNTRNIDGFKLKRHTFDVVEATELDPGDPRPAANTEVAP